MKRILLFQVGKAEPELLNGLAAAIPQVFPAHLDVLASVLDPAPAFHGERSQYHSSELLDMMQKLVRPDCWRLLGITAVDLYIPILTYVFGEAQMGGPCAIASYHRLRQECYGLPPDKQLLQERLLKEAIHELGHTFDLTHCDDYRCVMASAHAVEGIDLKSNVPCLDCREKLGCKLTAHAL